MKTINTGNTRESIDNCLCYLDTNPSEHDQLRVSLIYGSGEYETRVGDELRLSKELRKRWWEHYNSHQLRLPFAFYQPARIENSRYYSSRDEFNLQVRHLHEDGAEQRVTLHFRRQSERQARRFGIRAIRIHKLITSHSRIRLDSRLANKAMRAGEDGLVVLIPSGEVYNKVTGEFVGTELRIDRDDRRPSELNGETLSLLQGAPNSMLATLRLPDGSDVSIHVYESVDHHRGSEFRVSHSGTRRVIRGDFTIHEYMNNCFTEE